MLLVASCYGNRVKLRLSGLPVARVQGLLLATQNTHRSASESQTPLWLHRKPNCITCGHLSKDCMIAGHNAAYSPIAQVSPVKPAGHSHWKKSPSKYGMQDAFWGQGPLEHEFYKRRK